MPLIFIHGVRQRNEQGLKNLEFEFGKMIDGLRSKCKLSDQFAVRAPYWGVLGAQPQSRKIIPVAYDAGEYESAESAPGVSPIQQLIDLCGGDEELVREMLREVIGREAIQADVRDEFDRLLESDLRTAYASFLARSTAAEGDGFESAEDATSEPRSVVVQRNALQWFGDVVQRGLTHVALSFPVIMHSYADIHENFALFVGDAMAYVIQREREGEDSPILQTVLNAIPETSTPGDPLIVVTHSMGGTIFYDILTTYRPRLEVACWFSVGSQISQFHSLGFFKNQADRRPGVPAAGEERARVSGLKPRVKHWCNIYDPLDPLNFIASTVFADVEDIQYRTARGPMSSHSWYFREPGFYKVLSDQLSQVLGAK